MAGPVPGLPTFWPCRSEVARAVPPDLTLLVPAKPEASRVEAQLRTLVMASWQPLVFWKPTVAAVRGSPPDSAGTVKIGAANGRSVPHGDHARLSLEMMHESACRRRTAIFPLHPRNESWALAFLRHRDGVLEVQCLSLGNPSAESAGQTPGEDGPGTNRRSACSERDPHLQLLGLTLPKGCYRGSFARWNALRSAHPFPRFPGDS